MKRILKGVGYFLLVIFVLLIGVVAYFWPELSSFPSLPSSYESKELCSCLFVEGRSQESCEKFIRQDVVPIDSRSIDSQNKRVVVKSLWLENSARFVSSEVGCVLE